MRVTSNGENIANVLYLTSGAVSRPYFYTFKDEEVFSSILYPINYYKITSGPAWVSLTDRTISGVPTYPST
jgi:hypothetical protein